jgi:GDSL-like Lipase/Acylhydrolase family
MRNVAKLALVALIAVVCVGASAATSASASESLFLTASKTKLLFTTDSFGATTLRGKLLGVEGVIKCEESKTHGFVLDKSPLARELYIEFKGKCEQTIGGSKGTCTEPIKPALSYGELGLLNGHVLLLVAPEKGTEFAEVKCAISSIKVAGAVIGEFSLKAADGSPQYDVLRKNFLLLFKASGVKQEPEEIELSGSLMKGVALKIEGAFGEKASEETVQLLLPTGQVEIFAGEETTKTGLATSLSGGGKEGETITVTEGTKVKDKATLTGKNASKATGKVTYKVYSEKECKTLVKEAGEATVSGESVPASSEEELEAGKAYYWQAHYGGDSNDGESTSPCTELLNVQAKTTIATKLSGEGKEGSELDVTQGAVVKDAATLSGTNVSTATGTVKYLLYSDLECKDLVAEAGEVTVSGEAVPASSSKTLSEGAYYWQAVYSGDALHVGSTSACGSETALVAPAVTTSLSAEGQSGEELEVLEGAGVSDTATLHGEHASIATGKLTYDVYSDDECKTLVKEAGEVTVSGESVPSSTEQTLSPGTYYWQAEYSGDTNNPKAKSACGVEISRVTTSTTIDTTLSGESKAGEHLEVKEGTGVTDAATLSGSNASTATGSVDYNVYSDSECKELVADAGEATVSGKSVPSSSEVKLSPGTYYWQAVYSGDGANHSATSSCGAETLVVTAPVTTVLSGEEKSGAEIEVEEGAGVSDTATLHGEHASIATGKLKYDVYSDDECKTLVKEAGEVTVSGASVPSSTEQTLSPGTYYWQAEYSGDTNNPKAKSACGTEIAIVRPAAWQYAAIGDSFSSGEGTLSYYTRTNGGENECHRSPTAYPARVAEVLFQGVIPSVTEEGQVMRQQPRFIFRACTSAVTENIQAFGQYNEWIEGAGRWAPKPAQVLWLQLPGGEEPPTGPNNNITLVTMTIGGNDSGFSIVANECIERPPYFNIAARCRQVITEWETGTVIASPPTLEHGRGISSLELKLPEVLNAIHAAAPNARIRIPLYPQILDTTRPRSIRVGLAGAAIGTLFINNTLGPNNVAAALEGFTRRLNETITQIVEAWARTERVNARVIPGTVNAFAAGHQLGSGGQLWVNEVSLVPGTTVPRSQTLHPNCLGHIALAKRVAPALGVFPSAKWAC